jgi:4'-phosphopantetheinyl transferase
VVVLHGLPAETAGIAVFVSRVDGQERRAARELAVHSAALVAGVRADEVQLEHDSTGRPVLGGAIEGLHISISHSRGVVAVALTELAPLGVDIEVMRPVDAVSLARRWFTTGEADWVNRQPGSLRERAFLWLWTCKEAIGKARGLGLRERGLRYPVPIPPDWTRARTSLSPINTALAVGTPRVTGGILLGVAVLAGEADVIVHNE